MPLEFPFSDLYVQELILKVWKRPRVLQKCAFKKIFKCIFSACVWSRILGTKLSKLLMTHHLGIWPEKNFHINFQNWKFFLFSKWFLKIHFFKKTRPVWHSSDQGPEVNVVSKFSISKVFVQYEFSKFFFGDFKIKSVSTNTSRYWKKSHVVRCRIKSSTS